jgi:hypothetical protein
MKELVVGRTIGKESWAQQGGAAVFRGPAPRCKRKF